jgi:hypothetical protein
MCAALGNQRFVCVDILNGDERGESTGEQMNRLSLRNNRLKFETSGKLPWILEEFREYTSN